MNPEHPVYIVSKGRWESRWTSKCFEAMGVPYSIIVEEQERDAYAAVIDPAKVIILDPQYQRAYDPCCALKPGQSKGSGPARNFAWDLAAEAGHGWHWVVDDNIRLFYRANRNKKIPVADGTIFKCMEDFADRYSNVAMAGPNYDEFVPRKRRYPPFIFNSRIYSCNLIRNDVPFRWRGRYNEDTILSLDLLKAGWCTILFCAFLQDKGPTMRMKGGNTDELYRDGTLAKSRLLIDVHPDCARLVQKYGRWHHHVDYLRFRKRRLIRKPGVEVQPGVDEYGMRLVHLEEHAA